jgi:uncharacterized protein YegP (UPF0339 family)
MPKVNRKPGIHLHKTIPRSQVRYEYYWILIAKNGKTIAKSSETYKTKRAAVGSILIAASIFLDAEPYELIQYYDHSKPGSPVKHC